MTSAIDHLVLGTADLAHGSAWLERYFGVALSSVGTHVRKGTHNRLLSLGPSCYLELIAIDPAGEPPFMKRWFGLDSADVRERIATKPRLLGWVAGTTEIETLSARTVACSTGCTAWRATTSNGVSPFPTMAIRSRQG